MVRSQPLFDDAIGAFAKGQNFVFRRSYYHGHALPSRVKFDHFQKLVLALAFPCLTQECTIIVVSLEEKAEMPRSVNQSELIWRGGIVDYVLLSVIGLFFITKDSVTKSKCLEKATCKLPVLCLTLRL